MKAIQHIFIANELLRLVNHTFLTIILKKTGVPDLKDFRPISCGKTLHIMWSQKKNSLTSVLPSILKISGSPVVPKWRKLHFNCGRPTSWGYPPCYFITRRYFGLLLSLTKLFSWDCSRLVDLIDNMIERCKFKLLFQAGKL